VNVMERGVDVAVVIFLIKSLLLNHGLFESHIPLMPSLSLEIGSKPRIILTSLLHILNVGIGHPS
jgi:hypothetical protein